MIPKCFLFPSCKHYCQNSSSSNMETYFRFIFRSNFETYFAFSIIIYSKGSDIWPFPLFGIDWTGHMTESKQTHKKRPAFVLDPFADLPPPKFTCRPVPQPSRSVFWSEFQGLLQSHRKVRLSAMLGWVGMKTTPFIYLSFFLERFKKQTQIYAKTKQT